MALKHRVHRYCHKAICLFRPPNPYQTRTGVLVHVFYHDLWDELAGYISNLRPLPFDLYVNLVDGEAGNEELTKRIRRRFPGVHVQATENRGRDIGGFLRLMDIVIRSGRAYDTFIVMHTKKSVRQEPGYGDSWRTRLLQSMLGRPERAAEI